ncbi:hypothetical protein AVEN_28967-1 [Araneus ventricosus]|uniref:Uncharacterized protein n=1 Tax=Araneus ventricosus TaxID=182803 RepID=A0A4Y2AJ70_ARAVE|nr:hypothetical protein AVEN_28967-1 [Araneus ventricosus]
MEGLTNSHQQTSHVVQFRSSSRNCGDEFRFKSKGNFLDKTLEVPPIKKAPKYNESGDCEGQAVRPFLPSHRPRRVMLHISRSLHSTLRKFTCRLFFHK